MSRVFLIDTDTASDRAVEVLIEEIRANPGLTLVTLGPLTNVAEAVGRAPERIRRRANSECLSCRQAYWAS